MEVSQARVLLLSSVATLGLGVTSLDAQKVSGAQITGHVIDKSTGEHLPGMSHQRDYIWNCHRQHWSLLSQTSQSW